MSKDKLNIKYLTTSSLSVTLNLERQKATFSFVLQLKLLTLQIQTHISSPDKEDSEELMDSSAF